MLINELLIGWRCTAWIRANSSRLRFLHSDFVCFQIYKMDRVSALVSILAGPVYYLSTTFYERQ